MWFAGIRLADAAFLLVMLKWSKSFRQRSAARYREIVVKKQVLTNHQSLVSTVVMEHESIVLLEQADQ